MIMPPDTRVPESYDKNAPKFDSNDPEDLLEFLENMDTIFEKAKIAVADRNEKIVKYLTPETKREWKGLPSYATGTHDEFLKEVINQYPTIRDQEKGSLVRLNKLLKKFPEYGITIDDQDELMSLIRPIQVEVKKLVPKKLTNKMAVSRFMEKLSPEFANRVWARLDMDEIALDSQPVDANDPAAVAAKAQRLVDREEERYVFSDIIRVARMLATDSIDRGEYDPGAATQATSTTRAKTEIVGVKFELGKQQREATADIKQWTVDQLDKRALEDKKWQKTSDERWESIQQFLKSSAPETNTVERVSKTTYETPNRGGNMARPAPNMNCHHCRLPGHFIGECNKRRHSIEIGQLKVIEGKDYYGDGENLYAPQNGPKSRATMIEDHYRGKASQNYQHNSGEAYSQMNQNEAYGEDYDSRNDELLTARTSEAKLRKQLAQGVSAQLVQQQSVQAVQPASTTPVDETGQVVQAVGLLVGITGQLQQQLNQLQQQQLAQTRSNPIKNTSNQEGFN